MRKLLFFLLSVTVFTSNCKAQETNSQKNLNKMVLEYSDGNGNYYKITIDSISFEPIKREMSSSGIYDGGEAKNKKITNREFKLVKKEFEHIFKNKAIQISNRMKTSGRLKWNESSEQKVIIIKKSDEQNQLELLLKELLDS